LTDYGHGRNVWVVTRTRRATRRTPIITRANGAPAASGAPPLRPGVAAPELWRLEHREDGARWMLTYAPTAQSVFFGARAAALAFAATPTALPYLQTQATDVITTGGALGGVLVVFHRDGPNEIRPDGDAGLAAQRVAHARAALAVLTGVLTHIQPQAHCGACAGWVTATACGWGHANACPACWTPRGGLAAPCPHLGGHHWCPTPAPARCSHCPRRDDLTQPCARGDILCCGCCLTNPEDTR
jgi:hypothetical protein